MFFAERMVDRGLAAHRRVDLREQGRRNLDERDAALIDGGGEARDVAHNAAAQRDDCGAPLTAMLEQRVEQRVERLPVLMCFSVGR